MDLSQLPKMSETPKPPPADTDDADRPSTPNGRPPVDYAPPRPAAGGAMGGVSVWISLIVGVIFLIFGANFGRWLIAGGHLATNVNWTAGPKAGTPVAYFELQGGTAWSEAGFFVMGVALILDAALLLLIYRSRSPRRALVLIALGVTGVALALNVGVGFYLFSISILPIATLIAVLTGGIMLFDQWAVWKESR